MNTGTEGAAINERAVMGGNGAPQAGNWVAIDRDVRFHPVVGFLDEDGTPRRGVVVCEMVAWLDLVMEANWRDREVNNKGKVMVIERGQLMAARNWLARRWGWSEDKVRWFFKKLATEGMITIPAPKTTQPVSVNRAQSKPQRRAHFANVITICNYNTYQAACELDALLSTQTNTQSTPKQHPHHNKETREQKPDIARAGEDRVEVNCEAIHLHFGGKSKTIPFSTIDLWAYNARMYDVERARKIVQGVMEGWVTDGKLPDKPSLEIQRRLKYGHIDDEVGQQRIANERRRAPPDKTAPVTQTGVIRGRA